MASRLEDQLAANPISVPASRRPPGDGGAPAEPGLYAWWLQNVSALPAVPALKHPARPQLGLLYIGIAPKNAKSAATIRSRIVNNHLGNSLGSSTLRRKLAYLLWEREGWHPFITPGGKVAIHRNECAALTRWMDQHLLVSWLNLAEPWEHEPTLIGYIATPLNSAHNPDNAYRAELDALRDNMLAVARLTTPASAPPPPAPLGRWT